ncbi:MAG: YfcC family protein [Saprospiraceae bacterium]
MKWYERIPHPVAMLFGMILLATVLSYLLPAGVYERILVEGRPRVVPGSYHTIKSTPIGLLEMFKAFSQAFKDASNIIFIVFAGGIMFGMLEASKTIENTVGAIVKNLGLKRKFHIVVIMTFVFGFLGVAVGYENNIALVPIAAVLSLALGGDLILAAGISVAAITVGFGLSPINPYTVGTGHKIAELPMFSGIVLRSILCFLALTTLAYYNVRYFQKILNDPSASLGKELDQSNFALSKPIDDYEITTNNYLVLFAFLGGLAIMLLGIFKYNWYLVEISAIFLMIAIVVGIVARMGSTHMSEIVLKSVAIVAPGAFMVGLATTIKVILEMGNISDTIAFQLSSVLSYLPSYFAAIVMSITQCIMNLMIPSGSGQALATLPIMIPVGELVGLTRQCSILAFQIGDGITNLVNPALGGLIAMLGLCRVPFDRWLRFILPLTLLILVLAWCFLLLSVAIHWGPA